MQTPDINGYQYPAFIVKSAGYVCAFIIFPRLFKKGVGYVVPPIVEDRIESVSAMLGHTNDDVLLVALNRQLETGLWKGIVDTARQQQKSVIAVATDCAERSERAVTQMREEFKDACRPLTESTKKEAD